MLVSAIQRFTTIVSEVYTEAVECRPSDDIVYIVSPLDSLGATSYRTSA